MFSIENRRYVGNKFQLTGWIRNIILAECSGCSSFFDVFAGTGSVSASMLDSFDVFYLNDFLFSNETVYKAFFGKGKVRRNLLDEIKDFYNSDDALFEKENYVSKMYGGKYFSYEDSKRIGNIREDLRQKFCDGKITEREFHILLASLLYSLDRIANTVGHYDAYIKKQIRQVIFNFELIAPLCTKGKKIHISREDSNILAKKIKADIAFVDPPYNSRQYSRFYHLLETITKWDNPPLYGTAMKPPEENMSGYCRTAAPRLFEDLINSLSVKYIAVTYNNTYNSKSSSSRNKITLEQIENILSKKGSVKCFQKEYRHFNAGKTDFKGHKEFLFITKAK